jgi:hypothetical protein
VNSAKTESYLFQSTFSGCALTAHLPRPLVAAWIPEGCELESDHQHLHPVIFLFGDQQRGAMVYGERAVSAPITYNEWAALVPGVRAGGQVFLFVASMVCNYPVAQFYGNNYYGYRKQLGSLHWTDRECEISVREPLMRATLEPATACGNAEADELFSTLQSPVLGLGSRGRFMHSCWKFQPEIAEFWRVGATLEVDRAFAPGVTPFSAVVSRDNGFLVRGVPWQLTAPMGSQANG